MDFKFEIIKNEIAKFTPLYNYDRKSFLFMITYSCHSLYWYLCGFTTFPYFSLIIILFLTFILIIIALIDKFIYKENGVGILNKLRTKLRKRDSDNYNIIKQILINNGIDTKEKSKFIYDYYINKQNNKKDIDFVTLISFLLAIASIIISFISLYNGTLSRSDVNELLFLIVYFIVIGFILVRGFYGLRRMLHRDNYEEICDILASIYFEYLEKEK